MGTILAIDPGNMESGYVIVEHDGKEIRKVLDVGKLPNDDMYNVFCSPYDHLAIEMVAGMGMPVGQEVFDTCFWIGRFWEYAELYRKGYQIQKDLPPGRKALLMRQSVGEGCEHQTSPRRPLCARSAELRQGNKEESRFLLRVRSGHVGGYGGGCDVFR